MEAASNSAFRVLANRLYSVRATMAEFLPAVGMIVVQPGGERSLRPLALGPLVPSPNAPSTEIPPRLRTMFSSTRGTTSRSTSTVIARTRLPSHLSWSSCRGASSIVIETPIPTPQTSRNTGICSLLELVTSPTAASIPRPPRSSRSSIPKDESPPDGCSASLRFQGRIPYLKASGQGEAKSIVDRSVEGCSECSD